LLIELIYSNHTERLLDKLVSDLKTGKQNGAHPLEPIEIVVPNRNMETWITLNLAQALGVAANLHFRRLERFIGALASAALPGRFTLVDLDQAEGAILACLLDEKILSGAPFSPVRQYLKSGEGLTEKAASDQHLAADGSDLRRVQLAARLAFLFQEYSFSRPEMIFAWRNNQKIGISATGSGPFPMVNPLYADPSLADASFASTAAWQQALWSAVFGPGCILDRNPPDDGSRWVTLDQLALDQQFFDELKKINLPPVHIFGVSYVARIFQLLFARLGEAGMLKIYTLNPCAEFWEDVETEREYFYRLDREQNRRSKRLWAETGEPEDDDPFGLYEADTPALKYWGRPGREYVRLLGELTDCDFESAFANPLKDQENLLQKLQADILFREPEKTSVAGAGETAEPDQSITLVAAPSVRREVEWVADEIWRLMQEDRPQPGQLPLRFSDIAIIVNNAGRDLYLPQIEAVFAACQNLPASISDLPGTAGSRMIEAMNLLLQLPFSRFSRSEVLTLISHPALIGRLEGLTPADLAQLTEQLGIIYGADHTDHLGTYIDEDVFNWDQAVRRLALGSFMTGEKSGDSRIFTAAQGRWLVEEVNTPITAQTAARLGLLLRSLIADARFVRSRKLTLAEWSKFYAAQVNLYLQADSSADEHDRLRLLNALVRLEKMDLGYKVSGRIAAELACRSLASLSGGRGRYLAEGVVVSSFLPMRALPFRAVFLLGLGESLFPASGRRDALDLRAAKRRAGDVDPSERDRYMFLETLLCARDRLYLTYVQRDEQTGERLQPSAVVQELMHILKKGYLGEDGLKNVIVNPPLRRYDSRQIIEETFIDEARVEFQIQEIARSRCEGVLALKPGSVITDQAGATAEQAQDDPWHKLSSMLLLPVKPPPAKPAPDFSPIIPEIQGTAAELLTFSASTLRRFLECPMQGWAAAMLGLPGDEEDLADREEEDFEINRMLETKHLRAVFVDASACGVNPAELYSERTARLRLAGKAPVGLPGRVMMEKHLQILSGWQRELANLTINQKSAHLKRVRFGRPYGQGCAGTVFDPLLLKVPSICCGTSEIEDLVQVRVSGLTEGLLATNMASVILQPATPPSSPGSRGQLVRIYKLMLRGIIDHILLSAVEAAGSEPRRVMLIYADGSGESRSFSLNLLPLDAASAHDWLTGVATDLLNGSHAYLLPCEAVFLDFDRQAKDHRKSKTTEGPEDSGGIRPLIYTPDGNWLSMTVKDLAAGDFNSFSSLFGPVPQPRRYDPPDPGEAAAMVERRFGPLFKMFSGAEGFR
jgi:exodeoxyribonuclease V gamma subunit